ncbi:hypothetical protein C458_13203 [Haloferax sp. ATCC BAA-644]|nr:hypothetical protein C458_13203 [Haloferax sp. ATCC BAA-644]
MSPLRDIDEAVGFEVVHEVAEPLRTRVAAVVDADPRPQLREAEVVVLTENSDDPPAELPPAPLETRLSRHVGRGEIARLVGVAEPPPRTAGLVAGGRLPAGHAPQFHDGVVPDAGLAVGHEFRGGGLERRVVVGDREGAVMYEMYYTFERHLFSG